MSNHYHLVLFIDQHKADILTDLEVIERWRKLYKMPDIIQRYLKCDKLSQAHHVLIKEIIDEWRQRLADISWYMRCLNEFIARKANFEDKCKGRFWEGRFKSQALLDEQALLTCMAYVELNPIRAKMADTPETSEFTSIKQRIDEEHNIKSNSKSTTKSNDSQTILLKSFIAKNTDLTDQIPYTYHEYLYLVDWTGRMLKEDKRGVIDNNLPPILIRLGVDPEYWCKTMQPKANNAFSRALGRQYKLRAYATKLEIGWIKDISLC